MGSSRGRMLGMETCGSIWEEGLEAGGQVSGVSLHWDLGQRARPQGPSLYSGTVGPSGLCPPQWCSP